jgi:hypothetical protein
MAKTDLEYRLDELAARLARVERRVGIIPPDLAAESSTDQPAIEVEKAPAEGLVASARQEEVESLPVDAPSALPTAPPIIPSSNSNPGPAPFRPRAIPPGLLNRTQEKVRAKADAFSTESLIGGRWFMVAGALVVVIGILLLLKQAYDAGWFGNLTPGMKCLAAAGFGAVLLVMGDIARRKINGAASAGLSGAGVATLYASTYAAYGLFQLLGPAPAFALLAAVSAVGVAVAVRAGLFSVAALSVVGSYLTPLLLHDAPSEATILPAYLLAVLGVGLWLSAWKRAPFRPLRAIVWWGTMIYGGLWTLSGDGAGHPVVATSFLGLVWCAVHGELTYTARRGAIGSVAPPASGRILYEMIRPLIASFGTSIWAVGLGVILLRRSTLGLPTWFPPAGGTVAAGFLALGLAGTLRVLRDRPRDDAERLGAALAMQAGALLIAAVALGLADWTEVVAWLAMGIAAVAVGRWIGGRALHVYGLIALAIGTGRLLVYDSWRMALTGPGVEVLLVHLTRWSALVMLAGGAWLGAAALLRWPRGEELYEDLPDLETHRAERAARDWWPAGHACIGLGLTLLGVALVHEKSLTTPIAVAFAGLAAVAGVAARKVRSEGLMKYAVVLLAMATTWLGFADWRTLTEQDRAVQVGGLILTRWSAGMALASVAWLAMWRQIRRWATDDREGPWVLVAPAMLATAITVIFASLLHLEGNSASESVVGLVLGLVMVWVARQSKRPILAWYSLVVLGLVTGWLLAFEWTTEGTAASVRGVGGLIVTRWTGLMLLMGAAWMVAGRSISDRLGTASLGVRVGGMGLGLALIFASLLHGNTEASWVCGAWLAMSAAVLCANRLDPRAGLDRFGLWGLALTLGAWVAAFAMHDWFASESAAGLHPGLLMALVMVAVAGAAWRLRRVLRAEFEPVAIMGAALAAASIGLVFAATSLEVARVAGDWASDERARKAAVSIWWGLFAIAMVTGGFWKRWPASRYAGLGLLAVATAKALIHDLSDITPTWRVASLLGLGLLMMAVAIGYSRVAQRLERAGHPGDAGDENPASGRDKSGMSAEP